MRYNVAAAGILALAGDVVAFPGVMDALQTRELSPEILKQRDVLQQRGDGGVHDPAIATNNFNAKAQYVSNTGAHAFVAPDLAGGDVRGPCPGLNAMANHGYLPHNGVGTHADFIKGTYDVFGMGLDLSAVLTILGGVLDGDGLRWSIGGPSKAMGLLPGLTGGLLGQPQGISGSHNKYECDVSPGRGDLYQYGDDFTLQMNQYQQLYDMGQANGDDYDLDLLTEFRSARFDQSIANNPYFFNGPFTGVLVQPAAFTFIYRFMSNKSAEFPGGKLNGDILNSFYGVTKNADGSLKKNPGQEKIPDNWYKRAIGDDYTIPFFNLDVVSAALKHPKFLSIGGNLGKVNTFTGVAPEDISGGVFNTPKLLEGNNLACFALEFAQQSSPDLIKCSSVLGGVTSAVQKLTSQVSSSLSALSCPQLTTIDENQFKQFPGYANLDCKTGTYK